MAISTSLNLNQSTSSLPPHHFNTHKLLPSPSFLTFNRQRKTSPLRTVTAQGSFSLKVSVTKTEIDARLSAAVGDGGTGKNDNTGGSGGGSGGGGGGGDNDDENMKKKNLEEALMALAEAGKSLESLPLDMKVAVEDGRIPGSIVLKYFDLEKSGFMSWLMKFGGFKERLLADDLFLAKVGIECGVGIFTKTAAEYEMRKENFFNELEVAFADVVKEVLADFMLVYFSAPTVSLRAPLALNAGCLPKFFYGFPNNAFQAALTGSSFSLLQRTGAIVRNGWKLFAVGGASSLVGTVVRSGFPNAHKAVGHSAANEGESVSMLSTSVAYGIYMAISSNLRYQLIAGIEQRILEPLLCGNKLLLSVSYFVVRTGNRNLGLLLGLAYTRFRGPQIAHDLEFNIESKWQSRGDSVSSTSVVPVSREISHRRLNEHQKIVQVGLVNVSGCSYR